MTGLIYGGGLLLLAFVLHVIVWRLRVPKRQGRGIVCVFLLTLIAGLALGVTTEYAKGNFWDHAFDQMISSSNWILLYISYTLAYLISFTAIEADSPSLVMVKQIMESGEKGLIPETLEKRIVNDDLVMPRIGDLLRDKMIIKERGHLVLTAKGRFLSQLFMYQRTLFRLGPGG